MSVWRVFHVVLNGHSLCYVSQTDRQTDRETPSQCCISLAYCSKRRPNSDTQFNYRMLPALSGVIADCRLMHVLHCSLYHANVRPLKAGYTSVLCLNPGMRPVCLGSGQSSSEPCASRDGLSVPTVSPFCC